MRFAVIVVVATLAAGALATLFSYWRYDYLLWQMKPEERMRHRHFKMRWPWWGMAYLEFLDSRAPQALGDPAVTAAWWLARVAFPVGAIAAFMVFVAGAVT